MFCKILFPNGVLGCCGNMNGCDPVPPRGGAELASHGVAHLFGNELHNMVASVSRGDVGKDSLLSEEGRTSELTEGSFCGQNHPSRQPGTYLQNDYPRLDGRQEDPH